MNYRAASEHIVNWLKEYHHNSGTQGFVVGVSGGIDSALTSTLCALTGAPVILLNMPLKQAGAEYKRGSAHIEDLKQKFSNVTAYEVPLDTTFAAFSAQIPEDFQDDLTMANARARLRMTTLYTFAGHHKMLVAGTGNKVEDFGIGFFTKYGDGGVDLSPIADLYKSEVYAMALELGVIDLILNAAPTDGLWDDGRTDEDQIGASYDELEWAMEYIRLEKDEKLDARQEEVLTLYKRLNRINQHKMRPIPVCELKGF